MSFSKTASAHATVLTMPWTNNGGNRVYFVGVQDNTNSPITFCIDSGSKNLDLNVQSITQTYAVTITGCYYTNS